ncbi:MAG: hypothetical protein Q8P80_02495 [Candidatus Levybacteria bacterium]|nr:hypothetical protein [Candidatus Levybacteria bacterium]
MIYSQDDNLMKTFLLILIIFTPPFIASGKIAFAQNITTGNSSAKSSVTTNVNGSGNVYTKIEVEANGEKKTLEASGPGNYKLEVGSSSSKSESKSSSSASTIKPSPWPKINRKSNDVASFMINEVQNLAKRIVRILQEFFIRP